MSGDEVAYSSIVEVGRRYRRGELSPVDVTEGLIERIRRTEPLINAYVTVDEDGLRAQAAAAERGLRDADALGPLHGIPISLKDNIATAGLADHRRIAGARRVMR